MRQGESFQSIRRMAVIVCTILAIFTTVFVSCSPGAADDGTSAGEPRQETTAPPVDTP